MAMKSSRNNSTTDLDHIVPSNLNSGSHFSEVQVKTSPFNRIRQSWLSITLGLLVIAGVLGTVGVTIVALGVHIQTTTTTTSTTSTSTTTSTTTSITTTTAIICFTIPSPRPSDIWYLVGNMTSSRIFHTSTYFSTNDFVLMAGGTNVLPYANPLISTEFYNPSTGCFQLGLNMPRARYYHTADILPAFSDYILFAGGYQTSGALSVADLFNPITGNTLTLSLTAPRYAHGSALFGSAQLVLIGGLGASGAALSTGDAMFSGSSSTFFAVTTNMSVPRSFLTVTRLGNTSGVVLIVGGEYYATSELYYGASNIFITLGSGGTMSAARAFHTATYLPAVNKVLVTGGCYDGWNYLDTMSLFDVPTLSFSSLTSTMSTRRAWHTATLLPNGKVLIVGGNNNTVASASCDLVDPSNNYLTTPAADLNIGRYEHTATLIPDNDTGTVLICGGTTNSANVLNSCELYIV